MSITSTWAILISVQHNKTTYKYFICIMVLYAIIKGSVLNNSHSRCWMCYCFRREFMLKCGVSLNVSFLAWVAILLAVVANRCWTNIETHREAGLNIDEERKKERQHAPPLVINSHPHHVFLGFNQTQRCVFLLVMMFVPSTLIHLTVFMLWIN